MTDTPKNFQIYGVLFVAQLAIGAAAIFARYSMHAAGPIMASALRLTIAAVLVLAFSWRKSRQISVPRKHEILFAACGLALAIHFCSWFVSLVYTSVAISTLLVCTSPAWTALYDTVILKKPASNKFWLAFAAGALGVGLIASTKSAAVSISGAALIGDLFATIGGIAFAAYLVAIRTVSSNYTTTVIVGRTYFWAAVFLCIAALSFHDKWPGSDFTSWGGIIAMALISQTLGHTALNASLKWLSASTVAFATLLEPVFAGVLAAIIFFEKLSLQQIVGSTIVLIAMAVILRIQDPVDAKTTSIPNP